MIDALRTPDERFTNLPGWGYAPHYIDDLSGYDGLRMHFVDEGPRDPGATFVCLHGEPNRSGAITRCPASRNTGIIFR